MRTFTSELLLEYDRNQNSWLEFDEFRRLYVTNFVDEDSVQKLRTRVQVRFRTEDEVKALAEERALLRRRAKLRCELEARRDVNRAIKMHQRNVRPVFACCRDSDMNSRQEKINSAHAARAAKFISNHRAATKRRRRWLTRSSNVVETRQIIAAGAGAKSHTTLCHIHHSSKYIVSTRNAVPHPAFAGRSFARESLQICHDLHPIFYGLARVPSSGSRITGLLATLKDVQRASCEGGRSWELFHPPPLYHRNSRHYHSHAASHDRSEIVHPAIWGSYMAAGNILKDASMSHPAILGYRLALQQQISHLNDHSYLQSPQQLRPLVHQQRVISGVDIAAKPCHICHSGQKGCPFCFEFPEGLRLNELAFLPGVIPSSKLQVHTDLTTYVALRQDRRVRHDCTEVLIKSLPCGAMLKLVVLCDDTVAHLHHLFRATSLHGFDDLALFYMPTLNGLIKMDIGINKIEEARGRIPLFRYGLNKPSARAVLFHGCHASISFAIGVFINSHLHLRLQDQLHASDLILHLDSTAGSLPNRDMIQIGLWNICMLKK